MSNYQDAIDKFIAALRESRIPVQEIYLYGSHARGQAHEHSDIDLGVVTEPFASDSLDETIALQRLAHSIDPALSPVALHAEDLANRYYALGQMIQSAGKPLLNSTG